MGIAPHLHLWRRDETKSRACRRTHNSCVMFYSRTAPADIALPSHTSAAHTQTTRVCAAAEFAFRRIEVDKFLIFHGRQTWTNRNPLLDCKSCLYTPRLCHIHKDLCGICRKNCALVFS